MIVSQGSRVALLKMFKPLFLLAAFGCVSTGALAYNAAEFPISSSAGRTTFGTGVIGGGSLGAGTLSVASDGTILAKGPVSFSAAGGLRVEAQLASRISKPAIALAFGRFFAKALPIVVVAGGLFDLAKELGFIPVATVGGVGVDFKYDFPAYLWSGDYVNYTANQSTECNKRAARLNTDSYSYTGSAGPFYYNCAMVEHKIAAPSTDTPFVYDIAYKLNPIGGSAPVSRQAFLDAVAARSGWPSGSALGPTLEQAIAGGETVEATPEVLTGPATIPGNSSKTVTATGSTTVTNVTNNTYNGPTVTTVTTTTTQNYSPSGVPIGPPVDSSTDAAPLPANPASNAPLKVCGLTAETACIIDEAGMPTKPDVDAAMKKTPTEVQKDIDDIAKNPTSVFPKFPTLNWDFALPSGCAQIPTPAFAPALTSIDVCQFKPMFHDVMGVVWVLGGLFGAISLFMKSALSD